MRQANEPNGLSSGTLLAIHDATNITRLSRAVFHTIESDIACAGVIAALRPLEFELPGLVSRPAHKKTFDRYIARDHKLDIWLKRSPIHPRVTVVRHSDYTPRSLLVRTKFYERVLRPMNADYASSFVVWRAKTWLATFTVFRSLRQGDFGPAELAYFRGLRLHVSSAIKRLAAQQERNLSRQGLEVFAEHSPQGVIVLDWQLNVLHYNQAARGLVRRWSGEVASRPRLDLRLPGDLRAALREMQPAIAATKPNRPLAPRHLHLRALVKRQAERLMARISFVPAKSLAISKGSFLIVIAEMAPVSARLLAGLDKLSRREAACIKSVAQGMSNPAIARELGVSPNTVRNQISAALRKLRMKSRYEVAAAVIQAGGAL
jgi:DNA-binding CsgD family transcriptional regulator/PAS domain-containing protein